MTVKKKFENWSIFDKVIRRRLQKCADLVGHHVLYNAI